jgi:hypothetical protein
METTRMEYPIIPTADIELVELLAGDPFHGRYRGRSTLGPVLVTLGGRPKSRNAEFLAAPLEGCVDALWFGELEYGRMPLLAVVEREPVGTPSCELSPRQLSRRDVVALAGAAERALRSMRCLGVQHGGLEPGQLYLDPSGAVSVVARMGLAFFVFERPCVGVMVAERLYRPEGPAADPEKHDAFNLACLLGHWFCGHHPFEAETIREHFQALRSGKPDLEGLPSELVEPMTAALTLSRTERPTASDLLRILVS